MTGWGSGFLPTTYQGVKFRSEGDPWRCLAGAAMGLATLVRPTGTTYDCAIPFNTPVRLSVTSAHLVLVGQNVTSLTPKSASAGSPDDAAGKAPYGV